jgi:hypothetical protein
LQGSPQGVLRVTAPVLFVQSVLAPNQLCRKSEFDNLNP